MKILKNIFKLFSINRIYQYLILVALLTMTLPMSAKAQLFEEKGVLLQLNRSYILYSHQEMPYIDQNGRTLIPFRMIGDLIGAEVSWDSKKKEATIIFDEVNIRAVIDNKEAWVNGKSYMMDTTPVIRNNTTMVPVRLIADALNIPIEWDSEYRVVTLKHEKFLKTPERLWRIDEMENLDEIFQGRIIPSKIRYTQEEDPEQNKLIVEVLNASDTTIKAHQLHKNLFSYTSKTEVWFTGTRGFTASSGMTGYNSSDVLPNTRFVDEIPKKSLLQTPSGELKYIICNYFKTTNKSN